MRSSSHEACAWPSAVRTDQAAIELAEQLNAAGYRTGAGRAFGVDAVANLRHYHQIPPANLLRKGEVTASELARRLRVGHGAVIQWIKRGWLAARRGLDHQWCIPFDAKIENACRERVASSVHLPRPGAEGKRDTERTVAEVVAALEVSTYVVYRWIERRQLPARRDRRDAGSSTSRRRSRRRVVSGSPARPTSRTLDHPRKTTQHLRKEAV
jgi:hypothetical protein